MDKKEVEYEKGNIDNVPIKESLFVIFDKNNEFFIMSSHKDVGMKIPGMIGNNHSIEELNRQMGLKVEKIEYVGRMKTYRDGKARYIENLYMGKLEEKTREKHNIYTMSVEDFELYLSFYPEESLYVPLVEKAYQQFKI